MPCSIVRVCSPFFFVGFIKEVMIQLVCVDNKLISVSELCCVHNEAVVTKGVRKSCRVL